MMEKVFARHRRLGPMHGALPERPLLHRFLELKFLHTLAQVLQVSKFLPQGQGAKNFSSLLEQKSSHALWYE